MSEPTKIIVVAMIALDDDNLADIPEDLNELSAYELGIRLGVGRAVPSPSLICLDSQDELKELMDAIEGMDITLDLRTDDRTKPKPETLDDLWTLLPTTPEVDAGYMPELSDPFTILPNDPAGPADDDNPFKIL